MITYNYRLYKNGITFVKQGQVQAYNQSHAIQILRDFHGYGFNIQLKAV